ncbi:tetratricopeptide repeat protein [Marinobacter sp.]|uniref:tetratricopeptide repeat protein n=1 Tax=Marinobacter sp. TaxID=50741 RepID=UPI003563A20F
MASFLLNDAAWPSVPWSFKKTNLLLHLLVGLLVYLVAYHVARHELNYSERRAFYISLFSASLWLLHPMNVSTVLYVVQRMAILSAIFILIGFYFYLIARRRRLAGESNLIWFLISLLSLFLGIFSKENALLLIIFIFALELFWFRPPTFQGLGSLKPAHLLMALVVVSLGLTLSYGVWGAGYSARDFGVMERLFYQAAALGDYILKLIIPQVDAFNLFNGQFENAKSFNFSSYFIIRIFVFLVAISLLFYLLKKRKFDFSFGLLWFFVFHLMESSILPLELYFEHRNYLPGIGLLFLAAVVVSSLYRKFRSIDSVFSVGSVAVLFYLGFCVFVLSITWANPGQLFVKWEMDSPESVRAKVVYSSYLENLGFPQNSIEHVDRALDLNPDSIGLHLRKIRVTCGEDVNGDVLKAISDFKRSTKFRHGVVDGIKKLIGLSDHDGYLVCSNGKIDFTLDEVFSLIEKNSKATSWPHTRSAQYFSLKSDYFARQRNLPQAIRALEQAITYQPSVDLNLKAAVMLASAQLYSEALDKLNAATRANEKRNVFVPSRSTELLSLERTIKKLMNRETKSE